LILTKGGWEQIISDQSPAAKSLADKNIMLEVTETAKDYLNEKAYDPIEGARPLSEVVQSEVEDRLSDALLRSKFSSGDTVEVNYDGEKIVVRAVAGTLPGGTKYKG